MSDFDNRITPVRDGLAASHLRGKVNARDFADGQKFSIIAGTAPLRANPSVQSGMVTELLFGETAQVYGRTNGWVWLQAERDNYVGYAQADVLGEAVTPTHRVAAMLTPVLSQPDVKSPLLDRLPLNAAVRVEAEDGTFARIASGGYVFSAHLAASNNPQSDFVAVAERFIGAPYVWGGKTWLGLDCSGLIQTVLQASGMDCPRDTDMQEAALGRALSANDQYRRGDLIYWKGHAGIMRDAQTLLHANAHHMAVASEPMAEAVARIEQSAGPIRAVKRLG